MNKQKILYYIDIFAYILLINGAIFAVFFNLLAGSALLYISLISFAISFLLITTFCLLKLIFSKSAGGEFELSKKQIVFLIFKMILSLFTLIIALLILLKW